jgi:Helicase conserved C-terminal domain/Type III restriction enzyme, res subunit
VRYGNDTDYLIVCGDKDVIADEDRNSTELDKIHVKVTTDKNEIREFLEGSAKDIRRKTIFSTIHSSYIVAEAMQGSTLEFNLAIIDEAHHTATRSDSDFTTVLNNELIPAKNRLFLTATPRNVIGTDVFSMDDESVYGKICYELKIGDAIERGVLCNYQVIVAVQTPDSGVTISNEESLARLLLKLVEENKISKVIAFANRVSTAYEFAQNIGSIFEKNCSQASWFSAIDGDIPSISRRHLIDSFAKNKQFSLLANCNCLSEGTNIPEIDGVLFVGPNIPRYTKSVQAIGRALRVSENKEIATIVLPVVIDPEEPITSEVNKKGYDTIKQFLGYLSVNDERFTTVLNDYKNNTKNTAGDTNLPLLIIDLPENKALKISKLNEYIQSAVVYHTNKAQKLDVEKICSYVEEYRRDNEGKFPTMETGEIFKTDFSQKLTWRAVSKALRSGKVEIPEGSNINSLATFLDFYYPAERVINLTTDQIKGYVENYKVNNNGIYPNKNSGIVPNSHIEGLTWSNIQQFLKKQAEYPKGLTSFYQLHLDVAERFRQDINLEELETAVKNYFLKNGKFPNKQVKEQIEGFPKGDTWVVINEAFRNRKRGITELDPSSLGVFTNEIKNRYHLSRLKAFDTDTPRLLNF